MCSYINWSRLPVNKAVFHKHMLKFIKERGREKTEVEAPFLIVIMYTLI